MADIKRAYQQCEEITKTHAPTYYQAFTFLPLKRRQAACAVYAFCHTAIMIDDKDERSALERDAEQCLTGTYEKNHFLWAALADAFRQFALEAEPFREFIAGIHENNEKTRFETLDELLMFAYQTGSTAGLMLLPILTKRNKEKLRQAAVSLGLAIQLTRMLRDAGKDYRRKRRICFPQQAMREFGYTEDDFCNETVNKAFVSTWEYVAFEAEAYAEECFDAISLFPRYSQSSVKAAASLYKAVLDKIRAEHYEVFTKNMALTEEEADAILQQLKKNPGSL
ncbi:phytoene/squalene synthase family protein [Bacillus atrophaeus]|uniref:phytoene/squalene synthase family protein n=1 Tax=Bacillus atrophaeus TaxID=1452 RepID=UPI001EFB21A8|nr:phytoene/squalene synthase family protein [Bacillus atrophaeus]MCG8395831.1 phytoene/squalene synthase family protein [Bacillus atrophaeus]